MDEEQLRLYNFLKHYNLEQYSENFKAIGVVKISHLKDVDDKDMIDMGMKRPEIQRIKKKLDANFSTMGKLKKKISGKDHQFDSSQLADTNPPKIPNTNKSKTLPERPHPLPTNTRESLSSPVIISSDNIILGKKLGEGAHGAVHEATYVMGQNKCKVAVKMVYTQKKGGASVESQFIKEAESMVKLDHQHIIKLYGLVLANPLMLVEEIAPLGDLLSFLKSRVITINMMYTYAVQLASAMEYLENMKIVHRDLAARNVLLVKEDHVLLTDFGLARNVKSSSVYQQTNPDIPLPTYWLSPEAMTDFKFSSSSDVWSYGVLLWEITSKGQRPWEGLQPKEVLHKLLFGERLVRPKYCYEELYNIMTSCWAESAEDRPKFANIFTRLLKAQSRPPTVEVKETHESGYGNGVLNEGSVLYALKKQEGGQWEGMGPEGQLVSFNEKKVTFLTQKVTLEPFANLLSHNQRHVENMKPQNYQEPLAINNPVDSPDQGSANSLKSIEEDPYTTMRSQWRNNDQVHYDYPLHQGSSSSLLDETYPPNTGKQLATPLTPSYEAVSSSIYSLATDISPVELFDPLAKRGNNGTTPPPPRPPKPSSNKDSSHFSSSSPPPSKESPTFPRPQSAGTTSHSTVSPLKPTPYSNSKIGGVSSSQQTTPTPWTVENKWADKSPVTTPPSHPPVVTPPSRPPVAVPTSASRIQGRGVPPSPPPRGPIEQNFYSIPTSSKTTPTDTPHQKTLETLKKEFPDVYSATLQRIVTKTNGNLEKAREEIKINQLMGFGLQYINEADCRRALTHCQGKLDRAGVWLLEQNDTIMERKRRLQ